MSTTKRSRGAEASGRGQVGPKSGGVGSVESLSQPMFMRVIDDAAHECRKTQIRGVSETRSVLTIER
jgi:hypothetical protein